MREGRPPQAILNRKFPYLAASSRAPFFLAFCFLAMLSALGVGTGVPAAAQEDPASRRAAAQAQFERAETLRATLEAKSERERSLQEYEALVSTYRRVYLITPRAVQVPPAIKTVGDLYRRMGEQFEARYFNSAIKTYEFLIRDYPDTKYREEALLAIADIQGKNLSERDLARKGYEDFLQQYPRSSYAPQARKALAEMQAPEKAENPSAARELPAASPPAPSLPPSGVMPSPQAAPGQNSEVSRVRIWNADNYTRIIIDLGGQAKYQAARISDPDRIYFDIENAKLSDELLHQPIEIPSGSYLKAVRVAQNRSDVVRVVLDVAKVKDYSVFELAAPDRLVVDVYGPGGKAIRSSNTGTASAGPVNAATVNAAANPAAGANATAGSSVKTVPLAAAPRPAVGFLPLSAKATSSLLPMPLAPYPVSAKMEMRPPLESVKGESGNSESVKNLAATIGPAPAAKPTRSGEHSLTRALGLKIGRIVIDPGHGGHDTGSIGPTGLMEKDLCLDVAQRLGKLIQQNFPSAEIVYTRQADKYVGLEQRTAIANQAKADLFVSIHANSSEDTKASGIETYYLNFNASPQAMEVAARENATAESSVHDLQDLVAKIARNEKIEESRDLAADVQESLATSLQAGNRPGRNRGVRKAPFVVLVGADMPSVLAEISFISNPADEQSLKKPENRQHAAEGLFHGIEKYLRSINSLTTTISPSVNPTHPQ
jgi:N-acetylmuramoyl-L-alanine amidase